MVERASDSLNAAVEQAAQLLAKEPAVAERQALAILKNFAQWGSGKPLRQLVREAGKGGAFNAVGTPDQVADQMIDLMEEVGGDGYLLQHPFNGISRRAFLEVTEGLVPALQRRGAVRTAYTTSTLQQTLREF